MKTFDEMSDGQKQQPEDDGDRLEPWNWTREQWERHLFDGYMLEGEIQKRTAGLALCLQLGGLIITRDDGWREVLLPETLAEEIPPDRLADAISILKILTHQLETRQFQIARANADRPPRRADEVELLKVEEVIQKYFPDRNRAWVLKQIRGKPFRVKKGRDIKIEKKGFLAWLKGSK